jgi:hypothetical protein
MGQPGEEIYIINDKGITGAYRNIIKKKAALPGFRFSATEFLQPDKYCYFSIYKFSVRTCNPFY